MQNELQGIGLKKGTYAWVDRKTQDFSVENHLGLLKEEIQKKITQRIIDKLQGLQDTNLIEKPEEKSESAAKFEFFLNEENENLKKMIKYQELEKKIHKLERLIGITTNIKVFLMNLVFI